METLIELKEEETTPSAITQITFNTSDITSDRRYQTISDLLNDEQMFRLDQDPPVFDLNNNSEDLSNNFNFPGMELSNILSDDYISKPEDIEMFQMLGLLDDDMKKEEENIKSPLSPVPIPAAAIIPTHTQMPAMKVMQPRAPPVSVKMQMPGEQKALKIEDSTRFDLISFITSNEVNILK